MWHFSQLDRRLGYEDGREIVAGETLTVDGPAVLCESGLHASERIIDALKYAPGSYIWEVELSGSSVLKDTDKAVGLSRKALWGYDATSVLKAFARKVALDSVNAHWNAAKLGEFPEIALRYLRTGEESIRAAAEAAARSAAEAAWEAAARSAVGYAAWAATWSAAEAAARSAWGAAAEAAAEAATRSAAWSAAAWAEARDSTRSAQNTLLENMIREGMPK